MTIVLVVLGCFALFGCGNNPLRKPLREKRPDGSPWIVRQGILSEDVDSLDPHVAFDQMSRRAMEPIYDTLFEYHPHKTEPFTLMPCMVEAMPEVSQKADGTVTYQFRLKRGINYHDDPCFPNGKGREILARDVGFTLQRVCDPKVLSPMFGYVSPHILGMKEAHASAKANRGAGFDYSKSISGFEEVDSHTFRIHLNGPFPQLLYWMGMHFFTPVAREAVEYYDGREERLPNGKKVKRPLFKNHPVGNGAFRFPPGESYEPGRGARLVRNENYRTLTFPGDALPPDRADWLRQFVGKPLPLVDELHLTVFQETTAMATLGRQGYLDSMGLQKDAFDVFVTSDRQLSPEFKQRGMTLAEDREPAVFWLMLNLEDPVLGPNKKLRQALAAAMDRDAYIEKFFNGIPLKAPQLLPPGIPGHEPGWKDPYDYNLEKARQLMVEAGYPGGRDPKTNAPLRISMDMIASSALERQMAQFQVQKMRDIGVELQVIENEFAPLINKQDSGNFQISSGSGWGADYPDAENFFALFHGPKVFPNGKNGSRYRNPEYDQCFEKMAVMENSPERTEIIHRMNHMLAEDVPVILLYYKRYFSVIAPWARRTHDNSMLEGGFKYAWIDAPMRDRLQREWNTPVLWPLWLVLFGCAVLGAYGIHLNRVRNV